MRKAALGLLIIGPLLLGMLLGVFFAYALNLPSDLIFSAQIVSAIIISVGNFGGIYFGFRRLENRADKKIDHYTGKFRRSKEGATFLEVLDDIQKLLKSEEAKELLEGLTEAMKELRSFLKQLRERATQPEEEEEEEVLPTLAKKKKKT